MKVARFLIVRCGSSQKASNSANPIDDSGSLGGSFVITTLALFSISAQKYRGNRAKLNDRTGRFSVT